MKQFNICNPLRSITVAAAMLWCSNAFAYLDFEHDWHREVQYQYTYTLVDGIYYDFDEESATASVEPKSYIHYLYRWREGNSGGSWCLCYFDTETGGYSGLLNIPSTVTYEGKTYTVTKIDNYALSNCPELTQLVIPETVIELGDFLTIKTYNEDEEYLIDPYSPNKLYSIRVNENNPVFDSRNGCNAIIETATNKLKFGCKNTKIPEGIRSIGRSAFFGLQSLTEITIPSSVEVIGTLVGTPYEFEADYDPAFDSHSYWMDYAMGAFSHSGLTTITLHDNLKVVGHNAFASTPLQTVYAGPFPAYNLKAFDYHARINLYVPKGCAYAYENQILPEPYYSWWWGGADWSFWNYINIQEITVDCTDLSLYDNAIYAVDVTGWAGKEVNLPIDMKTTYDVKSFQFDINLPDGVELLTSESGDYVVEKTSRVPKSYELEIAKPGTALLNTWRVMAYPSGLNGKIADREGTVLNLALSIPDDISLIGEQVVKVSNVKITRTSNTTDLIEDEFISKITVPSYTMGDVDGNRDINVGDVTSMIEAIYGQPADNYDQRAADIDGNGVVDVNDLVCVIDIIYERTSAESNAPRRNAARMIDQTGMMMGLGLTEAMAGEEVVLPIVMKGSATDVRGCQLDVTLPQGFELIDCTLPASLEGSYKLYNAEVGAQTYRLLTVTNEMTTLVPDEAVALLHLRLNKKMTSGEYAVTMSNIALGNGAEGYTLEPQTAAISVVDAAGIESLDADQDEVQRYDLMGRRVAAGNDARISVMKGVKNVIR